MITAKDKNNKELIACEHFMSYSVNIAIKVETK